MRRIMLNLFFLYFSVTFLSAYYSGDLSKAVVSIKQELVAYKINKDSKRLELREQTTKLILPDPAWVKFRTDFMQGRAVNFDVLKVRIEGSMVNRVVREDIPP